MENGQGSLWIYAPNQVAPVLFAAFFAGSGVWHGWQCSKYGSWHVTVLLPWSALMFLVGLILREVGAYTYDNSGLFISSTVFIDIATPFYALSTYVILARLFQYIPYHAPVHPGRSINTFYSLTWFIVTLIWNGVSQAGNPPNTPHQMTVGKALLKTSLVLQLVVMLLFISMAARWQWNSSRGGKVGTAQRGAGRNVKGILVTVYCSCALIICRTLYRIVACFELAPASPGRSFDPNSLSPIIRYEWYFWAFEAVFMLSNSVLWNLMHPAQNLPRSDRTYLARDGTEREGVEFRDPREFWVKVVDLFDICGLVTGYNGQWWVTENERMDSSAGAGLEE